MFVKLLLKIQRFRTKVIANYNAESYTYFFYRKDKLFVLNELQYLFYVKSKRYQVFMFKVKKYLACI